MYIPSNLIYPYLHEAIYLRMLRKVGENWMILNLILKKKLKKHRAAHLHGIVILDKNWFAFQEPYTGDEITIHVFSDNALLRFTNALLRGIQSMPMNIAIN